MTEKETIEQIHALIKQLPITVNRQIYAFKKVKDDGWIVSYVLGNPNLLDTPLNTSKHSSRDKALRSFFCRNPKVQTFYVVLEETPEKDKTE